MKQAVIIMLKGLWIGGTLTVPGVSGGSMAMLLGIYDKLIFSINSVFKRKKSILFLAEFLAGSLAGIFLFSKSLLLLIERYPMPMRYFFLGAVAGGVPLILNQAKVRRFSWKVVAYPVVGIGLVALIALIPTGLFSPDTHTGAGGFFLQLLGGLIVAIALVLPGISVSHMLLMLGLYEGIMTSVSTFQILPLIPFGIGLVGGILLTSNVLEKAMRAFPQATYLMIFGFLLGSLPELFPGVPTGWDLPLSLFTAAAGFTGVYAMFRLEQKKSALQTRQKER